MAVFASCICDHTTHNNIKVQETSRNALQNWQYKAFADAKRSSNENSLTRWLCVCVNKPIPFKWKMNNPKIMSTKRWSDTREHMCALEILWYRCTVHGVWCSFLARIHIPIRNSLYRIFLYLIIQTHTHNYNARNSINFTIADYLIIETWCIRIANQSRVAQFKCCLLLYCIKFSYQCMQSVIVCHSERLSDFALCLIAAHEKPINLSQAHFTAQDLHIQYSHSHFHSFTIGISNWCAHSRITAKYVAHLL